MQGVDYCTKHARARYGLERVPIFLSPHMATYVNTPLVLGAVLRAASWSEKVAALWVESSQASPEVAFDLYALGIPVLIQRR